MSDPSGASERRKTQRRRATRRATDRPSEGLFNEANETLKLILDSITDKFFAIDNEWRYTYFNKHAEEQLRALGKNPATLIGRVLWEEFPNPTSAEDLRRAMSERVVVTHEHYYGPLGEWYKNRIYPSPDGGLFVFQSYVTERKRAEEQLIYQAKLLENVHDAVIATDENLAVTAWNKGAEQMYGWRADEVMGRHIWEAVPAEMSEEQRAEVLRALAETGRFRIEAATYGKDGRPVYVEGITITLRGEQGETTGYVNIRRDISERKRSEEALRESHRRIKNILESITEDFYTVDREWRFTYINERAFSSVQSVRRGELKREDLLGRNMWECFPELVGTVFYQKYHEAMLEQKTVEVEAYSPLRGHWAEVHAYPSEEGLAVHIFDITERKLAEEALREAQAELAHAVRVATLGEMTASIAHEINQPLGAIVTNSQACLRLLSRDEPDLEGVRESIDAMIKDAIRASEVINRIRAFSKKGAPDRASLDINQMVRGVMSLVVSEIARHQVSFQTELGTDLPQVLGDRVELQQVLLNLILNAVEAMSGEGWQPRELLIISQQLDPAEVTVTVRDTGIGLEAQSAGRIFDAFFSTKTNDGGLGLGLSISRTIIESHGGRLWATPNKGKGATFWFALPAGYI